MIIIIIIIIIIITITIIMYFLITVYCNKHNTRRRVFGRISCCIYHTVCSFRKPWRHSCRFHANCNRATVIFRSHFFPLNGCPSTTTLSRNVETRGTVDKFWRRFVYKEQVMKSVRQFDWSTQRDK